MKRIIKKQAEATYYTQNNDSTYIETIFELEDGRFFEGRRYTSQSQKSFRSLFLKWLKKHDGSGHEYPYCKKEDTPDLFEFTDCIEFTYN